MPSVKKVGAFVKLDDEINGLIHISEISADEEIKDVSKALKMGEKVEAKIISIDADEHRVGLSIKALTEKPKKEKEEKEEKETEEEKKEE